MLFGKKTYRTLRKAVLVRVTLEQQEMHLQYCMLTRTRKTNAPTKWVQVSDADELVKKAGKHLPYVLHFSGFGVLARIVENAPNYKESLLVSGGEEDFYFSCYELPHTVAVSFLRRSLAAPLIDQLTGLKVFLHALHTGPSVLPAICEANGQLQLDYSLEMVNGDIRKLERNTGESKRFATASGFVDTETAYEMAVAALTFTEVPAYVQGFDQDYQEETQRNYHEYVRFVRLGIGILAFFLLTLTGNYLYINHLNSVAAQMEADISGFEANMAMSERLEQEKQRKLVLIENSGVQSTRYLSNYLDEIGASVPAAVQLASLETFPLKEPLKPKRRVELNMQQITLTGYSGSSKVLDDWMELLERKKWVASVELINYVRINDQKATFQLLVKIAG